MKFCFVILHYRTSSDTIECVKSIEAMNKKCAIVIVDNASNNGSIEKVEEYVKGKEETFIIKNTRNLGFAAGNNVGYRFAKYELRADFIAISNNDVIVVTKDMVSITQKLYADTRFYLLGPDIESMVNHGHQNPMKASEASLGIIKKEILRYSLLYFISRVGLYDLLRKKRQSDNMMCSGIKAKNEINIQLHGSFIIFSPLFIEKENIAFRNGTFLYMEESILYRYCVSHNYLTLYSPEIRVLHKEDSSTDSMFNGNRQKREFVFKNMIQSLKVYINVLKDEA